MWNRLKRRGILVTRKRVRLLLKELDGNGVTLRQRRRLKRRDYVNPGPNFVWHIDGYDKLKPYGFAIHGAIDGFSRRVMWLEVGVTNNNPFVILKYYIDTIMSLKKLPCIIRSDHGTENVQVYDLHTTLRKDHNDDFAGNSSFMYGKSSSNQRIERWWGILRTQCVQFWMNLFKDLVAIGALDTGSNFHIAALRFCFMNLIEDDIQRCAQEWNSHLIQSRKACEVQKGKPDLLYFVPELYEAADEGFCCNPQDLIPVEESLFNMNIIPEHIDTKLVDLVNDNLPNWTVPQNSIEAVELYRDIIEVIEPLY